MTVIPEVISTFAVECAKLNQRSEAGQRLNVVARMVHGAAEYPRADLKRGMDARRGQAESRRHSIEKHSELSDDSDEHSKHRNCTRGDWFFARCQRLKPNAFGIGEVATQNGITSVNQCQNLVSVATRFLLADDDKIVFGDAVVTARVVFDFNTGVIAAAEDVHEVRDFRVFAGT